VTLQPAPPTDALRRGELLAYRRFALLCAVALPLLGYLHHRATPGAFDPPAQRLVVTVLCLAIVALTYRRSQRFLVETIYFTFSVTTGWAFELLVLNRFHADYAIGAMVIVAIVIVGFLDHRPLRAYLLAVFASLLLMAWLAPPSLPQRVTPDIFFTYLAVFSVLAGLTLRGRLALVRKLAASRARFELAAEGSNDGIWDWDLSTGRVYYSPRWKEMLGCEDEALAGRPEAWLERVHPEDAAALRRELERHFAGETLQLECAYRMRHRDGQWRWMLARGAALRGPDGRAHRVAGSQTDVTDRRRAEAQLLHEALHDSLTGLPNRALFQERLAQLFRRRPDGPGFAGLFFDLDRFKVINDSLGHAAGDELLRIIGGRLHECVSADDTVARLGGDEFAIVLAEIESHAQVRHIAARVQEVVAVPATLGTSEVVTTASIGIAVGPAAYAGGDEMLRDADLAMYRAKAQGPGQLVLFDESMYEMSRASLELETDLRRAIERGELRLHYQPIVSLERRRLLGFEALVRWEHARRGLLAPAEFIGLAEETGLILPLGRWVLENACRQMKGWQERFPLRAPASVSVNVSGKQLAHPDFVGDVAAALASTGLAPGHLRLEITESVLLSDPDAAVRVLAELRTLGVQLHLDDFGTGYSSLLYLHRFPIDAVKFDRSFV
jgi:diguanylate cyclase (GGDEF)-like protein/PAS domain S-box-containing protein